MRPSRYCVKDETIRLPMANSRHLWTKKLQELEGRIDAARSSGRPPLAEDLRQKRDLRRRLNRLDRVEEQRRMQKVRVRPSS